MSDGLSLEFRQTSSTDDGTNRFTLSNAPTRNEPEIDLTTFSQWIEIQPPSTIVGILDILGNDLYRRLLPTAACTVKGVVKDLRSILRHLEEERRV